MPLPLVLVPVVEALSVNKHSCTEPATANTPELRQLHGVVDVHPDGVAARRQVGVVAFKGVRERPVDARRCKGPLVSRAMPVI